MPSSPNSIPATPRIISPSPSLSDRSDARDGYFAPTTRSAARRQRRSEAAEDAAEPESTPSGAVRQRRPERRSNPKIPASPPSTNGSASNGFLSPTSRIPEALRDLSRSPSPLGLIPLHTRYRSFIHRHEIPRKVLHVSIGFLTLHLYSRGIQTLQITPVLFTLLVPIALTDLIRHRSEKVNKFYTRCLGALMRETEVSGYNGVIWYPPWRICCPEILPQGRWRYGWCDTAASTFGRLWGRYTPRLRPGKSLAGTLAAWAVGVITAAAFWGWFVPYIGTFPDDPEDAFMFKGRLNLLPDSVRGLLGWTGDSSSTTITGPLALGVMSVVSGVVAAGSEFIDLWNWDDNLTIPVLSGLGLWGFLKVFG
ncbi:uncharacterized protein N7477_000373 [Penicillium maclennaniae]|uniref:uncharacterized protein n=1 Tax=Penicillium maclennaniae TaxID=1343394 RepID=UPI0025411843|nr:uncharacterized protein N7477_000373 [Penicillium maclennaniae]KAJ5684028.1 hypothetical protein N7477_000373 [Penicillium maclennaniae]